VELRGENKILFKNIAQGYYVTIGTTGKLYCTSDGLGNEFTVNIKAALRIYDGKYLNINPVSDTFGTANKARLFEMFIVQPESFMSISISRFTAKRYIGVSGSNIIATVSEVGDNEKFEFCIISPTRVALRASNSRYLRVDQNTVPGKVTITADGDQYSTEPSCIFEIILYNADMEEKSED